MEFIFKWEGGYVFHPNDPGGETNWGISKRAHPELDIKNLTEEEAKEIYREEYWNPIGGDELTYRDALVVMDFAVHSGVGTALRYWERAEGARDYLILRTEFLRVIKDSDGNLLFSKFGRGWMARINDLHRELNNAEINPDVELIQIFDGPTVTEYRPVKVTVGRTRRGRTKYMVRLS